MSRRQVTVEYSGSTSLDIDEPSIADGLGADPTDAEIIAAIEHDIADYMDRSDVKPVLHTYHYDHDARIESVRGEIARRKASDG
mgnify:CR=1 FL=1